MSCESCATTSYFYCKYCIMQKAIIIDDEAKGMAEEEGGGWVVWSVWE